ncbi:MAG: hypothetical protein DRJ49_06005 [Thermoprotei archaeon]|nr:MAG: hypothetical protein DRJ49_06005 [Thermoprotei archaeon]
MVDLRSWGIREIYFPDRKIVVTSVELESGINNIINILKSLSEHGINILSCILQAHPDRPLVQTTLFLDLTDADIVSEEVSSLLRATSYVKRIELLDLPLNHGEARLVVFTLEDIHYLFGMLRELGNGGLAIMYHMGFRAGKALAERILSYFKDSKRSLMYTLLYNESLGHGKFKLEEYIERAYCRIVARELSECLEVKSDKPNSQLFRGILAGCISKLWDEEVEVKETKCIAMGDPYCEFEVEIK